MRCYRPPWSDFVPFRMMAAGFWRVFDAELWVVEGLVTSGLGAGGSVTKGGGREGGNRGRRPVRGVVGGDGAEYNFFSGV